MLAAIGPFEGLSRIRPFMYLRFGAIPGCSGRARRKARRNKGLSNS